MMLCTEKGVCVEAQDSWCSRRSSVEGLPSIRTVDTEDRKLKTKFQNGFITGHSHHMCNRDPWLPHSLQHNGDWDRNILANIVG